MRLIKSNMKVNIIAAVSKNGVIGQNNDLPWKDKYPEDMKFFRKMTAGATVICGRSTYDSFGARPLPKRRNIVVSKDKRYVDTGAEVYGSVEEAIRNTYPLVGEEGPDAWLIGGSSIYRDGMAHMTPGDEIYLTLIPETVTGENLVFFPWIDPTKFQTVELIPIEGSVLKVAKYIRI